MLRYLKMDLIAACVVVTSLLGAARFHLAPAMGPTGQTSVSDLRTPISQKAFIAPTVAVEVARPARKLPRPLQMLANLGRASWYGSVLEGHRTASGEIFHKDDLTACHRTLPFGTMVKVVDVSSGRSVVVRINDRGTLSGDRIIDLSSGAAQSLGILKAGVARVRLEVLKKVSGVAQLEAKSEKDVPVDLPASF